MTEANDWLEQFWNDILSRDQDKICSSYRSVSEAEQRDCLAHLRVMVIDPEYHEAQRESAQAALDILAAEK